MFGLARGGAVGLRRLEHGGEEAGGVVWSAVVAGRLDLDDLVLLVTIGLSLVTVVVSYGLSFELQGDDVDESTQTGRIITSLPFLQLVHLVVNAAVVEQFFYRGFLIERLVDLTRRPLFAHALCDTPILLAG